MQWMGVDSGRTFSSLSVSSEAEQNACVMTISEALEVIQLREEPLDQKHQQHFLVDPECMQANDFGSVLGA